MQKKECEYENMTLDQMKILMHSLEKTHNSLISVSKSQEMLIDILKEKINNLPWIVKKFFI